jgi:RHS repeat-associated protein
VSSTSYNAANQQLTFGDKTLTYDNNGNVNTISDPNGTANYNWNARNKLNTVSGPGLNTSFVYDGMGRREKKTINGNLTEFLYDGVNPVQETSGATVLANILTATGIDEFLSRTDISAGTTGHFLSDALGSTIALTDSAGTVQTEYTYQPFGEDSFVGAPSPNPYKFTGREDDNTGLYYYRARYYDSQRQRFLSEDPIISPSFIGCPSNENLIFRMALSSGGALGQAANLYGYVNNQPITLNDPSGLGQCENQLSECNRPINARHLKCMNNVVAAVSVCIAGCSVLCVPAGPTYPACVSGCIAATCSIVAIGGSASCFAASAMDRFNCLMDYYNCKQKGRNTKSIS